MIFDIFLYILGYDIWFYLSHILLHKVQWLNIIHSEHHKINYKTMIYSDAYVGHNFEGVFQSVGIFLPIVYIKFNIIPFIISVLLVNIRGMMRHDIRFIWLIGNHHILHHKYPNYNYGEYWLDTLFTTKYNNKKEYIKGLIYM